MSFSRSAQSSQSTRRPLPTASALGPLVRFSLLTLSALLVVASLAASPGSAQAADAAAAAELENDTAWELSAQQDGIDVYTRPVAGSGIKEFKGVADIDASLITIGALLRDSDQLKTWFPNTPESKLLKREGEVAYQYSVMATPWPISDRDNVLRSVTQTDREAGVMRITVTAAPDEHPEQTDRVRVRKANGSWLLKAVNESKTRVTFQMHLEPGGGIPQWMINARVVGTPLEAITNLRQAVKAN